MATKSNASTASGKAASSSKGKGGKGKSALPAPAAEGQLLTQPAPLAPPAGVVTAAQAEQATAHVAPQVIAGALEAQVEQDQRHELRRESDKQLLAAVQGRRNGIADFANHTMTAPVAVPQPAKPRSLTMAELGQVNTKPATGEGQAAQPAARRTALREQNGMTRPNPGTVGDRIWCVIDEHSAQVQRPVTIGELKQNPKLANELAVNVSSIYARWRKFNGVSGRLPAPAVAPTPATAPQAGEEAQDAASASPAQ